MSIAFHLESDGKPEKVNRVIRTCSGHMWEPTSIRGTHQDDWDEFLNVARFASKNAKHASRKESLSC